jgi:hypothetical protein
MGRSVSDPGMGQAVGGSQRALEHEPPAPVDIVPGTAKRCVRHSTFRPLGQIVIKRSRQPLPEIASPCCTMRSAGRFIGRNDPHRALSSSILSDLNVHPSAYKFETERHPFS